MTVFHSKYSELIYRLIKYLEGESMSSENLLKTSEDMRLKDLMKNTF